MSDPTPTLTDEDRDDLFEWLDARFAGSHEDRYADLDSLAPLIARMVAEAEQRALREAAILMSGVGKHRPPCRLPDTPCLCGVCDFREEATRLLRELSERIGGGDRG